MNSIIFILIVLFLLGAFGGTLPVWQHSNTWGPGPSFGIGTILVILVIWYLLGRP